MQRLMEEVSSSLSGSFDCRVNRNPVDGSIGQLFIGDDAVGNGREQFNQAVEAGIATVRVIEQGEWLVEYEAEDNAME